MKARIFDDSIDSLLTLLEEGARASSHSVKRFIEPMKGTLRRAKSKRHHLVFGRRGSGKSSLLYKSADALSKDGSAVAYVDLEPFKGHHYPDVLISVLLATLIKFHNQIDAFLPGAKPSLFRRLWSRRKRNSKENKRTLLYRLSSEIGELRSQLHLADSSQVTSKTSDTSEARATESTGLHSRSALPIVNLRVESEIASEVRSAALLETQEEFRRSKIDHLHRKILDYQALFAEIANFADTDCFLFLDDLYHIARPDQPPLLDYFHRIAKGNRLWLKIGTIKHRSTWYVHTPQPMGLKGGDDADEINLDLTLEKFSTSKSFLTQVLDSYIEEAQSLAREELISDTGLTRLVIASGGVTRDFLALFRRSIDEARERLSKRPDHPRGEKVSAEDVNMAAGSYGDYKQEEFKKDTLEDQERLSEAFEKVRRFCLEKTQKNVFLIDQDATDPDSNLLQELIDLRLIHHVKSRVTVSDRPTMVYRALLLDVSQYTGERKRRDIEMIEFWKDDRQILRKPGSIYAPSITVSELENLIAKETKSGRRESAETRQETLGLEE